MLRPYQVQAVDQIREKMQQGYKKVLLHMATGGGKTVVICDIMKRLDQKNRKVVLVVRGRKLVDQCHKRLICENIKHGVLMSGHSHRNAKANIQICSIDTVLAREDFPSAYMVIYDEAHHCISKGYKEFSKKYPNALHLGVTATPFVEKSLRHIADVIIKPISVKELIDQGYLSPPVYYAPANIDLSGVKISASTKDFIGAQLDKVMNNNTIIGDLVKNWLEFAQDRPTLVFAASVNHSKHIAKLFNDQGITAAHCDADTPEKIRAATIESFERGEIKVLTNVGLWCTGVDIPCIGCIVMARPTMSYNLYIQQMGRGTRTYKNKKDFILLDNAGNVLRHGFITDDRNGCIDGEPEKPKETMIRTCKKCFFVFEQFKKECPNCGFINPPIEINRTPEEIAGKLIRLENMSMEELAQFELKQLKKEKREKKYKRGWIFHKLKDKYGQEIAGKLCPAKVKPSWL